jgi:hypothetical protein
VLPRERPGLRVLPRDERIYRPVAIRSDAELTLLKMAFMRAS